MSVKENENSLIYNWWRNWIQRKIRLNTLIHFEFYILLIKTFNKSLCIYFFNKRSHESQQYLRKIVTQLLIDKSCVPLFINRTHPGVNGVWFIMPIHCWIENRQGQGRRTITKNSHQSGCFDHFPSMFNAALPS